MERKVQKTGRGTLIVSLPRDWVKKNSLKSGDSVEVLEISENSILIKVKRIEKEKVSINFESIDITFREIVSKYIKGYKRLEINFKNNWKEMALLREMCLKKIPGVEIEDVRNKLTLEFMDYEEVEPEKLVRRIFNSVLWMLRNLKLYMENRDMFLLREAVNKDDEIDRYNLLLNRKLYMSLKYFTGDIDRDKILLFKNVIDKIESMGDSVQMLISHIDRIDRDKKSKSVVKFLDTVIQLIERTKTSAFSENKDEYNYIIDESVKQTHNVLKQIKKSEDVLILSVFFRLFQLIKEIGEAFIDYI